MSAEHWDLDQDNTMGGDTPSPNKAPSQKAVNEFVKSQGGGSSIDVQINGTSITNNDVANIVTNSAYDESSNKIATMSDVKQEVFIGTKGTTTFQQFKDAYDSGMMLYALEPDDTYGIYSFKRFYTASSKDILEFTRTYRYSTGIRTEVWTFSSAGDTYSDSTIIREQVNSDWSATSGKAQILNKPELFSGNYNDLSNKPNLATVATTGDYDDLTNKPTIPENEIFIAEYNVTSYSDISTAYNAGKTIYCKYTSGSYSYYYIPFVHFTGIEFVFCGTMDSDDIISTTCNSINIWSTERSYKVTSISSSSTDAEYPSAKCVYDIVKDQNNTSRILKFWTGTKAQYDAIATKSSSTLYNITDDQDITLSLLQTIYPVGSVYLSTNATCPLASLFGTWTLVSSGRALWTGTGYNGGSTIEAGLPNLAGATGCNSFNNYVPVSYPFYRTTTTHNVASSGTNKPYDVYFDANLANPIYGNSTTVQPPAYVVNVWRRTA